LLFLNAADDIVTHSRDDDFRRSLYTVHVAEIFCDSSAC